MASISLLEGKKQLLKIQVPRFVGLQHAFHWGTVLRRALSVKLSRLALGLMSVFLSLYLLLQFYMQYSGKKITVTVRVIIYSKNYFHVAMVCKVSVVFSCKYYRIEVDFSNMDGFVPAC